jgi:diadenosine tetraphosphate (Ap4A) HIT family hydrolase
MGCDIAEHKLIPPGGYIYEDELINVAADPEIPIVGFMILGIKKHVKSINELERDERIHIMDILNTTIEKMKNANICDEVLLIQEEKSSHFHIWIVPAHEWMNDFNKNVRNLKEIIDYSKRNFDEKTKDDLLNAIELLKEEFKKTSK